MITIKKVTQIIIALLILAIFIILCSKAGFIQDDSYISLQYAKNFFSGNGLVFNAGQRVEGFTSFLWVMIITPAYFLKINPEIYVKVLSITFGVLCLIVTYFLTKTIMQKNKFVLETDSYFFFLPVILLVFSSTFYYWAESGMETTLYTFLCLIGTYYYLLRNVKTKYLYLAIFFLTLAFLTRQEAVLIISIFTANSLLEQLKRNKYKFYIRKIFSHEIIIFISIFLFPSIIFLLFRFIYFGYLFPNTFYAKTGTSSDYLKAGLQYTITFFKNYLLYGALVIPPLLLLINKKLIKKLILFYAIITAYIIYIIMVGGDVLAMHRFFIPIMPFIYILFTIFLFQIYHLVFNIIKNNIIRNGLLVCVVFAICLNIHLNNYQESISMSQKENTFTSLMKNIGLKMKEQKEKSGRQILIAATTIGALKYFSNCNVLDMLGLTDKYIAHNPFHIKIISDYNSGWKERNYNVRYVLQQKPDYIIFSTGEKPSSFAERALFTDQDFFKCYFVENIFVDSSGMPRNAYKRYSQANILLRQGIVQRNKNYSPAFVNLYNVFLNQINRQASLNNLERLNNSFNKLIECSPSYFAEPYRFMASFYHDKGDDLKALEYLNKCINIDSLNLYSRIFIYELSKTQGLNALAHKQAKYIKNHFPEVYTHYNFDTEKDNPSNIVNLIKNNLKRGNYEKATALKNDLEKIQIEDLKKKGELYSSAAYYFGGSGRYEESIGLMKKAVEFQPKNGNFLNDLGAYYYLTGKTDLARKYFSGAVKLSPSNKEFQKNFSLASKQKN